jgi:hypothetical protein
LEVIYYTLVAAGLYFISDWLLNWIEILRGQRFQNRVLRSLVYFMIILVLASLSFGLINYFAVPAK